MNTIGKNIQKLLEKNSLTQTELSKIIEVDNTTISSWVRGKTIPRMDKVDKICKVFNCTRSELLEEPTDFILRQKEKEIISVVETLNDKGMERLLAYANELKEIYGVEKC